MEIDDFCYMSERHGRRTGRAYMDVKRTIASVSIFEEGLGRRVIKMDVGSVSVATFSLLLFLLFIYCDGGKLLPERLRWMQGGLGRAVLLARVWAGSSRL